MYIYGYHNDKAEVNQIHSFMLSFLLQIKRTYVLHLRLFPIMVVFIENCVQIFVAKIAPLRQLNEHDFSNLHKWCEFNFSVCLRVSQSLKAWPAQYQVESLS